MSDDIPTLIDRFAAGGSVLRRAIEGLESHDLHAKPGPGKWSIHELVIHLADSDAIGIDRMKRVIAEEEPRFYGADESAYIERLHCGAQSLEDALLLFDIGRRQFARVLRELPASAFERAGHHNEAGRVTLLDLLRTYADHLDHHLTFLDEKRSRLGKPLNREETP